MKLTLNNNKLMSLALCLFAAYTVMLAPVDANATQTIGSLLCGVVSWFTGTIGQGIATLAIIIIGIGALMGKVSWGMAIIVGIGVALIFGAPTLVDEIASFNPESGQGCR
jgi:type IV secretion system protein VirB2